MHFGMGEQLQGAGKRFSARVTTMLRIFGTLGTSIPSAAHHIRGQLLVLLPGVAPQQVLPVK